MSSHVDLDAALRAHGETPTIPARDDLAGLCAWLTEVFDLDPQHPVKGAVHQGRRGPDGHVVVQRVDAPEIAFEPASQINAPTKLIPALSWQLLPTDGPVRAFKGDHCRDISYVLRMLCGTSASMAREQEADAIVSTFTSAATPVYQRTTYGSSAQRYEAAVSLRRDEDRITGHRHGPARYLIDANTGELVIAVSDLQEAARRHEGSSLPRGWLDARMEAMDWERITLASYGLPSRNGRTGPHARIDAYRGHRLAAPADPTTAEGGVNT